MKIYKTAQPIEDFNSALQNDVNETIRNAIIRNYPEIDPDYLPMIMDDDQMHSAILYLADRAEDVVDNWKAHISVTGNQKPNPAQM